MEGVTATWREGLLDWSWSAFTRWYDVGVVDVRSLRRGRDGDFGSDSRELVYGHPSGDVGRGKILTTTDAPPLLHLSESVGEVWERNLLEDFFCLYLWHLQSGDRPVYLFASL